ncbi:MAG TPA: 2OG-Fe(II) oxygenase [Candidatus Kapabacteria bacterium]|nr:2OG-Fe(II) oxygenase [Candidatus Kapabacteria bacterium]
MNEGMGQKRIFDYERWGAQLAGLKSRYQGNAPFPHLVLEDFLDKDSLEGALADFEALDNSDAWINYVHFNENKMGMSKIDALPPGLQGVIRHLNSPDFVRFLSALSGIESLKADESCEGGGIHQSTRGGFLNIHADFTVHPHHRNWRRRMNVIVYLGKDWQDEWGGHLELWNRGMTTCEVRVAPLFNRCVIFNTDANSFHGHPEPMNCPDGCFRRSIALYYYTEEESPLKRATNYRARPDDGVKKVLIRIDSLMVSIYTVIKSFLGSNDNFASQFLKAIQKIVRKI